MTKVQSDDLGSILKFATDFLCDSGEVTLCLNQLLYAEFTLDSNILHIYNIWGNVVYAEGGRDLLKFCLVCYKGTACIIPEK